MTPKEFLDILAVAGRTKMTTRHCFNANGRQESVAEHSWRIALMAMLLSGEEEFAALDMNKVIRMCLIHDLGEAFTGDIPAFVKTDADAQTEDDLFHGWVAGFPAAQKEEWTSLLAEMEALQTKEAQVYKALDKVEALISHNESDLSTWLPLEYDLQFTYGQENMKCSPYLMKLREAVDAWTKKKIAEGQNMKAELLIESHCINAEGPVWDDETQTFYFIDVEAGKIFSWKDNTLTAWEAGEKIGCAVLRKEGGMLAGLHSGICAVDFPDGGKTLLASPEAHLPGNRFNDGKVDPRGRFFAGTLTMTRPEGKEGPLAALYRLDADIKSDTGYAAKKVIDKVGLANGLAWSADGTKFYFIDTNANTVSEYAYDMETGEVGAGHVIINVPAEMGHPDGCTIDEDGNLWVALWGGCAVSKWDPRTGQLLGKIELPAKNVSSCCFGGPEMKDLFITTASLETDMEEYPLAGSVFAVRTDVSGTRSHRYKG